MKDKFNIDPFTEILQYRIDDACAKSTVSPIYQSSAFDSDSPYFYSRKNNPNVEEFEKVSSLLEDTRFGIAYNCGMSAIMMVVDLLNHGDTVVINNLIYGCTYKLFQRLSKRRGFELTILDLSNPDNIKKIPFGTRMVFFETPTNPFLKVLDIKKISAAAKSKNQDCLVVVDNTWATSLNQKPIKHGADISLHSCTKYFSGHSDVMGGIILVDKQKIYEQLIVDRFYAGSIMTPYHAWLMRRSVQTLQIRLHHQIKTTKEMRLFLSEIPKIKQVYFPEIDSSQLCDYGGILFFEFIDTLADKYEHFKKSLKLFGTGTGMACVTSMVAQPYTGSHSSMTDLEKIEMRISPALVRLCFGLENIQDLKCDLLSAFDAIS